jgi:hypothetical protein
MYSQFARFLRIPLLWPLPAFVISLLLLLQPLIWAPLRYFVALPAIALIFVFAIQCFSIVVLDTRRELANREPGKRDRVLALLIRIFICAVSGVLSIGMLGGTLWHVLLHCTECSSDLSWLR